MPTESPGDSTTIAAERDASTTSLVVCSLEAWGAVRRRMGILVDAVVDLEPSVQVLYVSPAQDVPHELLHGRTAGLSGPRLRRVHPRIHVLQPRKWLPRVAGAWADRGLERQVLDAVGELGLQDPLLWINDSAYAPLVDHTGWPTLYDITDDWLLAGMPPRQLARLTQNEDLLLRQADAVVVCSPELARTRGQVRQVELIPNGVDVELFQTPRSRPADLPPSPVAVYAGTLHAERIDVSLLVDLAAARPELAIVLVGPNSLPAEATARLTQTGSVHLLGARPYDQIPAYLQHADVVIVPHLVSPFTESLDPIKAYECLAAARPTVATPVAGFRALGPPVTVAGRGEFVRRTLDLVDSTGADGAGLITASIPTWHERAETMVSLMHRVRRDRAGR